eukprot:jgi/Mesvir1/11087/Mv02461-RA.1
MFQFLSHSAVDGESLKFKKRAKKAEKSSSTVGADAGSEKSKRGISKSLRKLQKLMKKKERKVRKLAEKLVGKKRKRKVVSDSDSSSSSSSDSEVTPWVNSLNPAPPPASHKPSTHGAAAPVVSAPHARSPAIPALVLTPEELRRRQVRSARFESTLEDASKVTPAPTEQPRRDDQPLQGQSQAVEKRYLRLTSRPDASSVRPEPVLRAALDLIKAKWLAAPDYERACEQLKSVRQDLTVQHIRNGFTCSVYETHARIAVERADWAEYNACAAVLGELYAEGVPGNAAEFAAYRLLYALAHGEGDAGHLAALRSLPHNVLAHVFVAHARSVCCAVRGGDYCSFFRLYACAPRMAPYLMDALVPRMRARALRAMLRGYFPSLPLAFVARSLGFGDPAQGFVVRDCAEYLGEQGVVLADGTDGTGAGGQVVDIKATRAGAGGGGVW